MKSVAWTMIWAVLGVTWILPVFGETLSADVLKGKKEYEQNNLSGAIESLGQALEKQSNDAVAHYYLALSFFRSGRKEEARTHFEKVIEFAPNSPMSRYSVYMIENVVTQPRAVRKEDGFIGIKFFREGRIVKVYKDSPADKAGIKVGDRIVAINGKAVDEYSVHSVSLKIIGRRGEPVKLTLLRNGTKFDITVKRGAIYPDAARQWKLDSETE